MEIKQDNWSERSKKMICEICMYFCNMRCRRNAPTMNGWPAVYKTDWCGNHKISKEYMGGN